MCGIAGILDLKGGTVSPNILKKMISTVHHRGPDDYGIYIDNSAGLGHARLSIIDVHSGRQPMCNEDGSIWITFNGEIFNYIELRDELEKRGHLFRTSSDTEVIVHLYEDFGTDCLTHLNGQFALGIWDRHKRGLFLARDRLGIRPLFYASINGCFYFASEIKSIFVTGEVERRIDPVGLDQIFTLWCTVPPRTAFENIYELPPGHYLTIKDNNLSVHKYWDIDFYNDDGAIDFEDASERLKELLIDATRLQLRSDVPVGAYLSGGIDSSVTTALIRHFSSSTLQTFSVTFTDRDFDESQYQKEMSESLGTEHNEIRCSYSDIMENFPDVIWHTEKPILRTAPTPLFLLSGLVRSKNFKVVLTGEGADEILGGYDIFKETKIREFCARFPDSRYRPLLLKRLYPYLPAFQSQPQFYMEAFFNRGMIETDDIFFSHRPRWNTTSKIKLFFSEEIKENTRDSSPEEALLDSLPEGFHQWSPLSRAQYLEIKNLLPGYILSSQGDRVSMAHSVEGRFPFLDHRVVEFCATLPARYKIKGLNEKYILKRTMRSHLPERIVKRYKQPYLAPDSKSFFHNGKVPDYVDELLSEQCINRYGYFKPKAVKCLVNKCKKGGTTGFKDNMAFVGILSTQILHRRFIEDFKNDVPLTKSIRVIKQARWHQ